MEAVIECNSECVLVARSETVHVLSEITHSTGSVYTRHVSSVVVVKRLACVFRTWCTLQLNVWAVVTDCSNGSVGTVVASMKRMTYCCCL